MAINVNLFYLASNPFFEAYIHSDFLGKCIFLGLVFLSVISWVILIHKGWITRQARVNSQEITQAFRNQRLNPLNLQIDEQKTLNPFANLYQVLKKHTLDILNKNQQSHKNTTNYLSPTDIDFVQAHLSSTIANQTKNLEKNLFILSTVVSLGPFLGLLGTVWGILTTFSELQAASGAATNQTVLSGLSLALATTVLGLLDAIPALIGYNYLKNSIRDFETDMESFSTEILASIELQYRKVDVF